MRRDQLEHAIRTACAIIGRPEVIVVGSQAILGSFREEDLPGAATMSIEVDILPIADDNDETARLADLIAGVAGEFSPFEMLHGFSIDGVDLETSALPLGWRDRLVRVQNADTAAPGGEPQFTGWCLDKEDLCAAKLCAYREKDLNFVAALQRGPCRPGRDRAATAYHGGPSPTCDRARADLARMTYLALTQFDPGQASATVTAWIASPASAPTTVPLIRMNCRSRPTATSMRSDASLPSHPATVRWMSETTVPP